MARGEKLNTPITELYKLPYYEYAMYISLEEESIKKAQTELDNTQHQETWEIDRVKPAEFGDKVNLPDNLKL